MQYNCCFKLIPGLILQPRDVIYASYSPNLLAACPFPFGQYYLASQKHAIVRDHDTGCQLWLLSFDRSLRFWLHRNIAMELAIWVAWLWVDKLCRTNGFSNHFCVPWIFVCSLRVPLLFRQVHVRDKTKEGEGVLQEADSVCQGTYLHAGYGFHSDDLHYSEHVVSLVCWIPWIAR